MTRYTFGGHIEDFLFSVLNSSSGALMAPPAGSTVTVWTAATGGTRITDLQDMLGNAITSVGIGSAGYLNQFQGPDSGGAFGAYATQFYIDGGDGTRQLMTNAEAAAAQAAASAASMVATTDAAMEPVLANPSSASSTVLTGLYTPIRYPAYVTTTSRSNLRSQPTSIYNFKSSNTKRLRAGFAHAMTPGGYASHVVIGDSLSAGCTEGVAAPYSFDRFAAWPISMRQEFARHGMPVAGTGWMLANDGNVGTDSRITLTGSWNTSLGINYAYTATAGDTATIVPDMGGKMLSFWVYDPGTGGGAYPFSITQNGTFLGGFSSVSGTAGFRLRTLSGNFSAGDTIVATAGANGLYLGAARIWNPAQGGIEVFNIAQSSSRAYDNGTAPARAWQNVTSTNALGLGWINSGGVARTITDGTLGALGSSLGSATANFTDSDLGRKVYLVGSTGTSVLTNNTAYITGITSTSAVTLSNGNLINAAQSGMTVQIGDSPAAVHIELGYNDLEQGYTIPQVTGAISAIVAMFPNSDVILHVFASPATSVLAQATFDSYASALYDLADTLNCVLVDHRERQGIHTDLEAVHLTGDNIAHQNAASYYTIGRSVAQALLQ